MSRASRSGQVYRAGKTSRRFPGPRPIGPPGIGTRGRWCSSRVDRARACTPLGGFRSWVRRASALTCSRSTRPPKRAGSRAPWRCRCWRGCRRRGLVVGVSGGVDSAVVVALAALAIGGARVLALLLPERDSSPESLSLGRMMAARLGLATEVVDLGAVLEASGCYAEQIAAIRTVFPEYGAGWRSKVVLRRSARAIGSTSSRWWWSRRAARCGARACPATPSGASSPPPT